MNRISQTFQRNKANNEGVLIPFITSGDPSITESIKIGKKLFDCGADILELGIPFSDPIADGPTIQASSHRALQNGMTTEKAMDIANALKNHGPIVFMTYYNIPLQYGLTKFVKKAKKCGVEGLIIPDLPIEEAEELYQTCKQNKMNLIFLVAPTTDNQRLEQIVKKSSGYLYLISSLGTTGARGKVQHETKKLIERVKNTCNGILPIAVGFGISKPKHVEQIINFGAEGIIIGSAIVKKIANGSLDKMEEFVTKLKNSTKKG
ncbi:MAG: tryptophan synthase subunit alpha [Candidatus Heimdallarchaeota archaeon]|nr:tryptophan synthase subunit alpha [Candidatus Heimdallarchaeota archaeon]